MATLFEAGTPFRAQGQTPCSASPVTRSSTISTEWAHPTPGVDPNGILLAAIEAAAHEVIYAIGAK